MNKAAVFVVFLFLCIGLILAQVVPTSYPYPIPHPVSGNTPTKLIRYSQTIGPSAYANENPLAWAIDIAGGLHSRTNAADRLALNPNWTQEGAIVYDASDKTYYGVNSNLIANVRLMSLTGPENIYTKDGVLTGPRIVDIGPTNTLMFVGNLLDIETRNSNLEAVETVTITAPNITIMGGGTLFSPGNVFRLASSNIYAGNAKIGATMQLISTNGQIDVFDPPGHFITTSNVFDLIRAPVGPNTANQYAETLGYYNVGDGGNGTYYARLMGSPGTNMGNFQSKFNTNYMWTVLSPREGIFLRQYGAKGDSFTDDTQAVKDWLHDINQRIGIVNVGTYLISPLYTEQGAALTIRGQRFAMMTAASSSGLFDGNCGTFLRKPSPGLETVSLFNVVSNAVLNVYGVVFDGNGAVETNATTAYLYLNNGGGTVEIDGCLFQNSAGHGVGLASQSCSWSFVRNTRVRNVNRGIRLNATIGVTLDNLRIQFCKDNALWLLGAAEFTKANNLLITDGKENGIILQSLHSRFQNTDIIGMYKSGIVFDVTNGATSFDNYFQHMTIRSANCLSNSFGPSPYGAALYSSVSVNGNLNTAVCTRNRFDGCYIGDASSLAGPNRSKYVYEWACPTGGAFEPWANWQFIGNQHIWNTGFTADYLPALTNSVAELGTIHAANSEIFNLFGKAGKIDSQGWRIDIVEAGTAATNKVLYANDVTHKILRDTTAIGTPVILTEPPPDRRVLPRLNPTGGPIPDP